MDVESSTGIQAHWHQLPALDGAISLLKQFVCRVHAFMHPSMPQEPLVILHCALQQGAAASMHDIVHPHQMQLPPPAAVSKSLHQCKSMSRSHMLHFHFDSGYGATLLQMPVDQSGSVSMMWTATISTAGIWVGEQGTEKDCMRSIMRV